MTCLADWCGWDGNAELGHKRLEFLIDDMKTIHGGEAMSSDAKADDDEREQQRVPCLNAPADGMRENHEMQ